MYFFRIDKFTISTNPISKVVVTDNWILYIGQWPWSFNMAHQSDVSVSLVQSEHHQISTEGEAGGTQFLTIQVKNRRPRTKSFQFRLNSLEYQNVTDKLQAPINNAQNIRIFKTTSERFLEVFREEIQQNPKVQMNEEELENCIGCMLVKSNVKLERRCLQGNQEDAPPTNDKCENCYCRPMWCIDCLGKW